MIAKDKVLHILAGAAVALFVLFGSPPWIIPTLCAAAVGGLKEVYDYVDNWLQSRKGKPERHNVDQADFWATVAGGLGGEIVFRILEKVLL